MLDPLVGQKLGQYELHARLGQGGMATVYRGYQPSLGRAVAVKVLPLGQLPNPTLPARFRREAQLAAGLMHPNIVPVYDYGEWGNWLYIVMALIPGGTLKDRAETPMSVEAVVHLVGQVADALGYAHAQGIYHRDVKPANVLLAASDWAVLGDFGIARALGESTRLTGPFGMIGTPAYMAPEQWLGGEIDGRTDLYALGIVLYELLAGSVPFTATTAEGLMRQHLDMPIPGLAAQRPGVPDAFEEVIQRALAKDPGHRFRHAGEFKSALSSAAAESHRPTAPIHAGVEKHGPASTTRPDLGATLRVPRNSASQRQGQDAERSHDVPPALLAIGLATALLLAGSVGFLAAGGGLGRPLGADPVTATDAPSRGEGNQVRPGASTVPPVTPPTSAPTAEARPAAPPTTVIVPTPISPIPTVTLPTQVPPSSTGTVADQRIIQIERRVGDYFAALNAKDYSRAHTICCTPSFRARYPLESWQRNFAGVSELRFATPFRYVSTNPQESIVDVDYSFVNTGGTRRYFTLRWTFVLIGSEWLADEAAASPQ